MLAFRTFIAPLLLTASFALAAAAPCVASTSIQSAATAGVFGFHELSTTGPGGSVTLPLSGLPALPSASFTTSGLDPGTWSDLTLGVDPGTSNLFQLPGPGKLLFLLPNQQVTGTDFGVFSRAAIIEIESSDAPVVNVYAGYDRNNNGLPDDAELACQGSWHQGDGNTTHCVVDLHAESASTRNVWVLVQIPQGDAAQTYHVGLISAVPSVGYVLPLFTGNTATGPGHTAANEGFDVQLSFSSSAGFRGRPTSISPGIRYFGALLVNGTPASSITRLGADGLIPFAITRMPGADDVLDALDDNTTLVLEPGESSLHRFIDVPGDSKILLTTACANATCPSTLDFYLTRADFPGFSASADIAPAPAPGTDAVRWTLDAANGAANFNIPVGAGRWYIAAHNRGAAEAQVYMYQYRQGASAAPAPSAPGAYYNPQRAGHGIFVSRSGDQQVLYWYTYGADGAPVWYVAQGTAPDGNFPVWVQPLFRLSWNGTALASIEEVGDISVTAISTTDLIYSWHLDGVGGSERFTLLGASTCLPFQGNYANFTGQWFAPAQAGYGVDVLALPGQQFDVFYFYDALGEPRWAAGSSGAFAEHTVLTMNQLAGFCPSCAYTPATATPIGTLTMDFSSAAQGSYATNLALAPPLSGTWNVNQPIARLTGDPTCGL